ncbi:MAG: hypothetical protein AB7G06_05170 [Bdellovibrionales bacterium]
MPILLYDKETTGAQKQDIKFGQALEVHASRVVRDSFEPGSDLKITESLAKDRDVIRCSLRPHTLYDPEALIVNGIELSEVRPRYNPAKGPSRIPLADRLYTNYEMNLAFENFVWRLSKHTRMYTGGYNTSEFDERVREQGRFQNLIPNTDDADFRVHIDILKFVRAAAHVYPDRFIIPKSSTDPDKRTFKQTEFAKANGIDMDEDKAHGARYDVDHLTFEIARLIRLRAPKVWDTMMTHADYQAMRKMVEENHGGIYYYVDTKFNELKAEPVYIFWPMPRPNSHHPRPQVLAINLGQSLTKFLKRHDITSLHQLIEEASKRPGPNNPLRMIDLRKNPFLVPLKGFKSHFGVDPYLKIKPELLDERLKQIRGAGKFIDGPLYEAALKWELPKKLKNGDPVEDFVHGDLTTEKRPLTHHARSKMLREEAAEESLLHRFHNESENWQERAEIMRQLQNPIHTEFALRLVGEHDFDALTPIEQRRYVNFLHLRLVGQKNKKMPWPTFDSVEKKIEKKLKDKKLPDAHRTAYEKMLVDHREWRREFMEFYDGWRNRTAPERPGRYQKQRFEYQHNGEKTVTLTV